MSNTQPPILNPHTAMAYLPPDLAYEMQIVGYVYVAILAVSTRSSTLIQQT